MPRARRVGLVPTRTTPLLKQRTMNQRPWMKQYYLWMKRKKSITISHTQQGTTPILTPFQQKWKNEDVRNRGDQHQEQEKVNKKN